MVYFFEILHNNRSNGFACRDYFVGKWNEYLRERKIESGETEAQFPAAYGVEERDAFYKSISFGGWGGASGHDAPMIA
jgi:ADP-ribosylarginine hydrolase